MQGRSRTRDTKRRTDGCPALTTWISADTARPLALGTTRPRKSPACVACYNKGRKKSNLLPQIPLAALTASQHSALDVRRRPALVRGAPEVVPHRHCSSRPARRPAGGRPTPAQQELRSAALPPLQPQRRDHMAHDGAPASPRSPASALSPTPTASTAVAIAAVLATAAAGRARIGRLSLVEHGACVVG